MPSRCPRGFARIEFRAQDFLMRRTVRLQGVKRGGRRLARDCEGHAQPEEANVDSIDFGFGKSLYNKSWRTLSWRSRTSTLSWRMSWMTIRTTVALAPTRSMAPMQSSSRVSRSTTERLSSRRTSLVSPMQTSRTSRTQTS